jgi:ferredoxin
MNRQYAESWPNITRKGEPPADGDNFKDKANKFETDFSPNPAKR